MKIKTTLEKVNEGLVLIQDEGGDVRVDGSEGRVKISGVDAGFSFDDGVLTIEIYDKPWLASDSMIESEIKNFFN
jgi:hypothetical protein